MLDPSGRPGGADVPLFPEVSTLGALARGARKRCPRCGGRGIFDGWFALKPKCGRCELRFAKEEGGFLGAMVLNYVVAFGVWTGVIAVTLIAMAPQVPVPQLLAMSVVVLTGTPLWFYPRSKGIWAAVEFLVERSQPGYRPPTRRDPRAKELE